MVQKISALALMGLATLFVACGGGGASTSTSEPSIEEIAAAQTAANSSLLTLADLPAGWVQDPPDVDDAKMGLTGDCAILEADEVTGQLAAAESADFTGPSSQGASSGTYVFPNQAAARAVYDRYASAVASCNDEVLVSFTEFLRGVLAEAGADPDSAEVAVVELDWPEQGDATNAYRIRSGFRAADGTTVDLAGDIITILQGSTIGYLSYNAFGDPDVAEQRQLSARLEEKLNVNTVVVESP